MENGEWNGMGNGRNGMEWNEWNGMNGMEWNGNMEWNGPHSEITVTDNAALFSPLHFFGKPAGNSHDAGSRSRR